MYSAQAHLELVAQMPEPEQERQAAISRVKTTVSVERRAVDSPDRWTRDGDEDDES